MIFDDPVLISGTVGKNLDYVFDVLKKDIPSEQEKLELLKKFNFNHDLKTKVSKLSLFDKFKLCFLRVFIKNSQVVFVDDILKNDFSSEELSELKNIMNFVLSDRLVFWAVNENNFKKNREFFEEFSATKIIYLSNANAVQYDSIDEFLKDPADLDVCLFASNLKQVEGYCVYQESCFYLKFEEKYVIKIDKKLNEYFEKLKLSNGENEDIIMFYDKSL